MSCSVGRAGGRVLGWIWVGTSLASMVARQAPAQTEEVTIELVLQLCFRWKQFVWVTSG